MSGLEVRFEQLPPLRVASFHGFGPSPEGVAWEKLVAWAGPRGYLDDPAHHRVFGFNNPDPSPGSPNYGYEFWMQVGPEVEPEAEVPIKEFAGGLYAVARSHGVEEIGPTWSKLVAWCEDSPYQWGCHCLEAGVTGLPGSDLVLDLFLPIAE
jgi:DNA gyrase inhibitor GyrI